MAPLKLSDLLVELMRVDLGLDLTRRRRRPKPVFLSEKDSMARLKRRLNFRTLLGDELDREPWEREGYDAEEEANFEAMEALLHLTNFELKQSEVALAQGKVTRPLAWSDEASTLTRDLAPCERTWRRVFGHLTSLRLDSRAIEVMDERLLKMHKLKALSLHDNKIRILQNLPGSLETLGISMNALETLGAQSTLQRCRALSVMLAAHNPLACLDGLAHIFPNLVVLDVSFGSLVSLEELEKTLGALPKLMSLNAACNPVALVKQYRMRLVLHLKALKRMDGLEVEDWERNTRLESRQIDMGAMILDKWQTALSRQKQMNFTKELSSEEQKTRYLAFYAALKLQRRYKMHKALEKAKIQRSILQASRAGQLVTVKVRVDWLKIPSLEVAPVDPKAKKDPKKVTPKGKPAVEEPEVVPPKELFAIRVSLAADFTAVHTLPFVEKQATMSFAQFDQDFQLPASSRQRDLFLHSGLRWQVWHKVEQATPAAEGPAAGIAAARQTEQRLVASGVLPLRSFFDPALFRESSGSPTIAEVLPLQLALGRPATPQGPQSQATPTPDGSPAQQQGPLDASLSLNVNLNPEFNEGNSLRWL